MAKKRKEISISKKTVDASISVDGLSANWFIFNFSKKTSKQQTSEVFKTLLPDNSLQTIKIEVSSDYNPTNKKKPTLPGSFAQDVFLSSIDLLFKKIRNLPELTVEKKRKDKILPKTKESEIPREYTTLYFTNKAIAENMGMTEKNSRISEALTHLKRTNIKITGILYKGDTIEVLNHHTNYISTYTSSNIRKGDNNADKNAITFDPFLMKQILAGYVSNLDKNKLLELPVGIPRKLYSILATKKMSFNQTNHSCIITEEELLATLQISKKVLSLNHKKYFKLLIDNKIISDFEVLKINETKVFSFKFYQNEILEHHSEVDQINVFFDSIRFLSSHDKYVKLAMESSSFNIDEDTLHDVIKINNIYSEVIHTDEFGNNHRINKAVYWAEILFWNIKNGQNNMSAKAVLMSCIKNNKKPSIRVAKKFAPISILAQQKKHSIEVEENLREERVKELKIAEKIREQAEIYSETITTSLKNKYLACYKKYKKQSELPQVFPTEGIFIKSMNSCAIRNGLIATETEAIYEALVDEMRGFKSKDPQYEIPLDI